MWLIIYGKPQSRDRNSKMTKENLSPACIQTLGTKSQCATNELGWVKDDDLNSGTYSRQLKLNGTNFKVISFSCLDDNQ